uniref:Arginyl-tRNA--protein transferase 1 n=1 Tax=Glossina brevipalpis TaxID=37001 RepID=A0A1A9W0X3_9MUSC
MGLTVIDYYGKQISKCGYCKGIQCSVGHGMHTYQMTPQDYQDLIDRGWRRSGHYCYKQDNKMTCCPCYTIKCDALEFKLTKSHKKILKRMTRFLRDGKKEASESRGFHSKNDEGVFDKDQAGEDGARGGIREEVHEPNIPLKNINLEAAGKANKNRQKYLTNEEKVTRTLYEASQLLDIKSIDSVKDMDTSQSTYNGMNPPCKKAKQMRLERKIAKQAAKGLMSETGGATTTKKSPKNAEKSLKDFIDDVTNADRHKLRIVLVPSSKNNYTERAFDLFCKYQLTVHNDTPDRLTPKRLQRFCYNSPLKLNIIHVNSKQFEETLMHSYALYEKYQTFVHNDRPNNVREYLDFLQRSPLKHCKPEDGPPLGFGSFHQQYWLDDQLIAVAVLDILPHCVSSVYFFYDPDYSFLSLGTYSSLREIELVQQLANSVSSLRYYYMGFYIHSCPKMRYKGKLCPSYLLCPETFTWHLLTDEIRSKLNAQKYQRFNPEVLARDVDEFLETDINNVLLLVDQNTCVTYRDYIQITDEDDRSTIMEYGKLVGKSLAHRIVYIKM